MNRRLLIEVWAILLILAGCGNTVSSGKTQNLTSLETTVNQTELDWKITVDAAEKVKNLASSQAVAQYNGSKANVNYNEAPDAGKEFLLVKLTVKKQAVGKSTFSWKNCYVMDENGNKYERMQDDTFLEHYGFKRLKAVDLTMGENTGYICVQVDEKASKFQFVHETDKATDQVEIPIK